MAGEAPKSFGEEFPHMAAAQKAAESVRPGNELQEAAAAGILRLAFEAEVRRAFPETPTNVESSVES